MPKKKPPFEGTKYAYDTEEEAMASLPEWFQEIKSSVMKTFRWVPDWETVGSLVRTRRIKSGLSLRSMSTYMGVSPTYVSDLERGLRAWPQRRLQDATTIIESAEAKQEPTK